MYIILMIGLTNSIFIYFYKLKMEFIKYIAKPVPPEISPIISGGMGLFNKITNPIENNIKKLKVFSDDTRHLDDKDYKVRKVPRIVSQAEKIINEKKDDAPDEISIQGTLIKSKVPEKKSLKRMTYTRRILEKKSKKKKTNKNIDSSSNVPISIGASLIDPDDEILDKIPRVYDIKKMSNFSELVSKFPFIKMSWPFIYRTANMIADKAKSLTWGKCIGIVLKMMKDYI